jgi:protein-S-isoprenylcysteine O-methyltransferase Ste14
MSQTQQGTPANLLRPLMRIPVPWVYILIYLIGVALEHAWPPGLLPPTRPGISIAGSTLFTIGAAIAGWGWLTFRIARTTTVPGRASSALVTWGPYRFTRNPMYVGLAIAYLGEAAIQHQTWPIFLLPLILAYVNWIVIPVEEAKLKEVFADEYERYQAKVRRWI